MNQERFQNARDRILLSQNRDSGIGTLSEKVLHATVKEYLEPYSGSREIKIGPYFADIAGQDGIYEIQTRALYKLANKLDSFLEICRVTVVHTITVVKHIKLFDSNTGKLIRQRISPRLGYVWDAFTELLGLKRYVLHPNFRFCIMLVEIEVHRTIDTNTMQKKNKYQSVSEFPLKLIDEIYFESSHDYQSLLPPELPETFTSTDLQKQTRANIKSIRSALNILNHVGAVKRLGRVNSAFLYKRTTSPILHDELLAD